MGANLLTYLLTYHLYHTDLPCKDEDEEMFAKITKYYCEKHNPVKSFGQSMS